MPPQPYVRYPWYAWMILVIACTFVGGGWIWISNFAGNPHIAIRIIGSILGGITLLVPAILGIRQLVLRKKNQ